MRNRLLAWWLAPAPPRRLALLRLLIGSFALCYLAYHAKNVLSTADFLPADFRPVGLVQLLQHPLPSWVVEVALASCAPLGVAFTLGYRYSVTAPCFAVLLLGLTSYRSSWGMVLHTDNLLTLHVGLLALAPAAAVLSWDARRARQAGLPEREEPEAQYGWPLRAMSLVTVITYALAGVAKLKLAGGIWLDGELLRTQIAYDNLRKIELGTAIFPLGPWLVRHRTLFPPLAWATMTLELGAPLALLHRRGALAFSVLAWAFHLGVLLTMSIAFVYQLTFLPYLPFFAVERWRRPRRKPHTEAPRPER